MILDQFSDPTLTKTSPERMWKNVIKKEIKSFFFRLPSIRFEYNFFTLIHDINHFNLSRLQIGSTIFCSIIHRNTKSHYKNEFVPIFFLHSCVAYDSFLCWNFCSEELSFFLESWIFFSWAYYWRCPLHYYYHLFSVHSQHIPTCLRESSVRLQPYVFSVRNARKMAYWMSNVHIFTMNLVALFEQVIFRERKMELISDF